jgi:formate dehydrogenase subunit gamma
MMTSAPVVRFSAAERVFHWAYAVAFVALALTGAVLYLPAVSLATGEAGTALRLLHRIFAVILLAAPLMPLVGSRGRFVGDLRDALAWRGADVRSAWILLTRYYWTGDGRGLPPQGKFTAGQKINIAMQAIAFAVLGATGVILWLGRDVAPVGIVRWSVLLHAAAAVGATCLGIIHVYMVTMLPMTKGAVATMILGTMDARYAAEHHPRWERRP